MFNHEIQSLDILQNTSISLGEGVSTKFSNNNSSGIGINFSVSGYFSGVVECHLLTDEINLEMTELNYLIPLFVESMNILIGRQLSHEADPISAIFRLSPPKLIRDMKIKNKDNMKFYDLNVNDVIYKIGINFDIKVIN